MKMLLMTLLVMFVHSCTQAPLKPIEPQEPIGPRIALYWENTTEPHPERKPWSDALTAVLNEDLAVYEKAQDFGRIFCPQWGSLSRVQKIKALGEFWVATAFYESGFNPKSASVDVGKQSDKDTWSVGLFQMSVIDQVSYKVPMGFDYNDLLEPIPNIKLALAVMKKQIESRGLIVVPSRPYWAVLFRGKYDKVDLIAGRVKKHAPFCK